MDEGRFIREAKWIFADEKTASPVIERSFCFLGERAELIISSLGFFCASINGVAVGKEYYTPSNSVFCKRDGSKFTYPIFDELTYRCYYSVYDVTELLTHGENLLSIRLGDGWYRQTDRTAEGDVSFGNTLGAVYALVFDGGESVLLSDGSETFRESEITYSQLFFGERWDFRFDAEAAPRYPVRTGEVDTELTREDAPPDRVIREITPKLIYEDRERKLYDAGENISGFARIRLTGRRGSRVTARYAENSDGVSLDFASSGADCNSPGGKRQIMEDVFISDGEERVAQVMFVWHAFRYFEVVGEGEATTVAVIHSDVEVTSEFNSSSRELNLLYDAFIRTQLDNMHGGVPLDCPHRERLGYTGDGQVASAAAMLLLDGRAFYRKWTRDIFDSQDKNTGHVNHTAPFGGGGGGPGGWGCAAVTVPYNYFKIYGDDSLIREYYPRMRAWIDYLLTRLEDGLITHEQEGGWCLGDWASLEPMDIPEPFVNTCYFIKALTLMEETARYLKKEDDASRFHALADGSRGAVERNYFDAETGSFCEGRLGADAFAVFARAGDGRTVKNLIKRYENMGYTDAGFLATDLIFDILFNNGAQDAAFALLTSHRLGSFGYMFDRGATTVWENWQGDSSHNHPMFGAVTRQLLSGILGIRQEEGSFGFSSLLISPQIPRGLDSASGKVRIPSGEVSVSFVRGSGELDFYICLPTGKAARFSCEGTECILKGGECRVRVRL